MTSEDTDTNLGAVEETVPPAEHDYAHAATSNSTEATSPSVTPATDGGVTPRESSPAAAESAHVAPEQPALPAELSEPAVGAEVDFPGGGNDVGPPVDTRKTPARRAGPRRHRQPEDSACSACKGAFERQGRSFNRRAVFTFTNPQTVQWVFPDSAAQDKSFLCETCAQVIRSKCKRKQSGKRSLWLKPAKQVSGTDDTPITVFLSTASRLTAIRRF